MVSDDVRIRWADGSETTLSGKPSVIAQARRDYLNGVITIEQFEGRAREHFEVAAANLPGARTPCRFPNCPDEAAYICEMDKGCVCYPDDRVQLLCAHHAHESEPLGSFSSTPVRA